MPCPPTHTHILVRCVPALHCSLDRHPVATDEWDRLSAGRRDVAPASPARAVATHVAEVVPALDEGQVSIGLGADARIREKQNFKTRLLLSENPGVPTADVDTPADRLHEEGLGVK